MNNITFAIIKPDAVKNRNTGKYMIVYYQQALKLKAQSYFA